MNMVRDSVLPANGATHVTIVVELDQLSAPKTRRRPTPAYENEIGRFHADLHAPLRKFAQISGAHADLLTTFPAAALAIVSRRLPAATRANARDMVGAGRSLPTIAAALKLPMWLKRLPPEALHAELPANLEAKDGMFGRLIANATPKVFKRGSTWLPQVFAARAACDDAFALWWAYRCTDAFRLDMITPIAAYAWYGARPELPATKYMRRRWSPRAHIAAMAHEAHCWHVRMLLEMQALEASLDPSRLSGGRHAGYEFVALDTAAALTAEGRIMGHCVGDYAERAAIGYSRIFSIRAAGERVATLEIRYRGGEAIGIEQISGPRNRTPPDDVLCAAHAWVRCLTAHPGCAELYGPPKINIAGWRALWAPYIAAKAAEGVAVAPPPECAAAALARTRDLMAATLSD